MDTQPRAFRQAAAVRADARRAERRADLACVRAEGIATATRSLVFKARCLLRGGRAAGPPDPRAERHEMARLMLMRALAAVRRAAGRWRPVLD